VLPPGNSLGALNDIGNSAVGPIRQESQNIPYEQTWSLGFQKELPGKILVDASYVGKKGTHLYLGEFREHNFLPASVLNLTPAARGALTNNDPNGSPFFFNGLRSKLLAFRAQYHSCPRNGSVPAI
jgi:hypothetical protein